nr:transglutaminase family protein [Candidatus Dadabacteria bacterium]NIS07793.1 transglutaminase family protein [Candidatus Dadabacteria bacterium]NIY21415.1 transglutaminase family protein [Candidatus Dadabacteria bacterium]
NPAPAGNTEAVDIDDNNINTVWFSGIHRKLVINSESVVEPLNKNPFGFLLTDNNFFSLPITHKARTYSHYLKKHSSNDGITNITNQVLKKSGNQTVEYLYNLNSFIYENFEKIIRETGKPWSASKTLKQNKGSCRDLSVLFMECCKSVGIPARFATGYNEIDIAIEDRHLHAWAEVYIPGGGWKGYDPALGLAVSDKHISLSSSSNPENTYPVTGNFRGTGASSELIYKIKIEEAA